LRSADYSCSAVISSGSICWRVRRRLSTEATLHAWTSVGLIQPSNEANKKQPKHFLFCIIFCMGEKSINQGQKEKNNLA